MASREGDNLWVYVVAIPKTGDCIMRDWASPAMRKDDENAILMVRKHLFKKIESFRGEAAEDLVNKVRAGERKLKKAEKDAAKSKKEAKDAQKQLNEVLAAADEIKAKEKAKKKQQKRRASTQLPEDKDDE